MAPLFFKLVGGAATAQDIEIPFGNDRCRFSFHFGDWKQAQCIFFGIWLNDFMVNSQMGPRYWTL